MKLRSAILLCLLAFATALSGCRVFVGVGHGGRHSRNCYPQRFCDRYGCHTRRVCRGGGWNHNNIATADANIEAQKNTQAWLEEFGISPQAQKVLDKAFLMALADNSDGLANLGLNESDIKRIADFKMPTNNGIAKMSSRLDITRDQGAKMVDFMITTAQEQAEDINSGLWQDCMDSGKWQTPQNNNCQKTYWNGCSPETGATMCIPVY